MTLPPNHPNCRCTMPDTTIYPAVSDHDFPDEVKAPKWKNVAFLANGKAIWGHPTHESEKSAIQKITPTVAMIMLDKGINPLAEYEGINGWFHAYQYHHMMALPWKDK